MQPLPIDSLLPNVIAALKTQRRLVLRAAPGAGKTTRVPIAVLDAELAGDKQVLVLEPRRIAARAAADFVARERGQVVGADIGYRVRFEHRGGAATRLWFLTEGVLGRQLAQDPFLEHAGVVVLDEFHERHLQGDIALAVVRELQETVRPDLKLIVMSATLETERLAALLGDCPVLTSEGRAFPVFIEYDQVSDDRPLAARVVSAFRRLSNDDDAGDVLVFLPGAAEIRKVTDALAPLATAGGFDVMPLHGNLPLEAQHRVLQRGPRRKVVLATNVAETALTVEGVTAVIDSGLARVARLDAKHGINALRVGPISRASADQRAGRAGRLRPGRCVRLWSEGAHAGRKAHEVPEIARLDLSATVLELRAWGLRDIDSFRWLDPPPAAGLQHAERLLVQLGAVDPRNGDLTMMGRRLLGLAAPPRLARIVIEAVAHGCGSAGALLAALVSERDIVVAARQIDRAKPSATAASDVLDRLHLFLAAARRDFRGDQCDAIGLDRRSVQAVERAWRQLCRAVDVPSTLPRDVDDERLLRCLLIGFPDRVVRRRAPGSARGIMASGTGVCLAPSSAVRDAELFVAVEVDAAAQRARAEATVRIASAIDAAWLTELFPGAVSDHDELIFDSTRRRILRRVQRRYEHLVLTERIDPDVDRLAAGALLAHHLRSSSDTLLPPGEAEAELLSRLQFLREWMPELGLPMDATGLRAEALAAVCAGCVSLAEVEQKDLAAYLNQGLSPQQRRALEMEAPVRYVLPSGRSVLVRYETGRSPAVAARIQELFGLTATPRLAAGRVPLLIEILAPSQRPVQITDDLESFWQRTYPEVRKQLRGRYPKHQWPEDPFAAKPTSRVGRPRP